MRAVDIIIKKRDKNVLTKKEIEFFIQGYVNGNIPDYQAAALAMAILLNGMSHQETTDLTMAMAYSGDVLDLTEVVKTSVDKHSTGGVGDKTTLVVEPIVAANGIPVGKMSGRGLGFSGGTLDKMESIPGYRTDLTTEEFIEQLQRIGLVLTGQSADLAPADGKLYALRDVTGTVQSIPLIASSIMSKKIAAGAQAIVLDVKVGEGAFMENLEDARELSKLMVAIAKLSRRKAVAILSDMNQPLGYAVGNALEVKEAIDTLHGKGPNDFYEHCLYIAANMLMLGGKVKSIDDGLVLAKEVTINGEAWQKFRDLVIAQGGDVETIDNPEMLPTALYREPLRASAAGYIHEINARIVGEAGVLLGAGRSRKGEPIDHAVGIVLHKKVGERIEMNEPILTIHANDEVKLGETKRFLLESIKIGQVPFKPYPLFYGMITEDDQSEFS